MPVFLYGELAGGPARAGAAARRRDRRAGRAHRLAASCAPTSAPRGCTRRAGATLVAARAPLVAFNLQLAPPATVAQARAHRRSDPRGRRRGPARAARDRRPALQADVAQVSMNVERPFELPLALVVERVRAPRRVASAELVGLAPQRRARGLPRRSALPGFDPAQRDRAALELGWQLSDSWMGRRMNDDSRVGFWSDGSDQTQAPDQAPRQRGRLCRVARAHRAQADRRGEGRRRARARQGPRGRRRQARSAADLARGVLKRDVRRRADAAGRDPAPASSPTRRSRCSRSCSSLYIADQLLHRHLDVQPAHAQQRPSQAVAARAAPR